MNENINLVEILKDCPKGTKFYSSMYGELIYSSMYTDSLDPKIYFIDENSSSMIDGSPMVVNYYRDGRLYATKGECTIFPSKDQRDWSKFTALWLKKERDKDKLIQELGEYKVKYTQEVLEKYINSMSNKDDERLRKTTIAFLKDFAEQGYENAIECIDWLKKQSEYTKKLYNSSVLSNSSNTRKNEQKFDPKTLQPYDKVLVKNDNSGSIWRVALFSCIMSNGIFCECIWDQGVPYNDETKHLIGTSDDPDEKYIWWKE